MRSLLEGESGEWRVQQRYRDCASNLKHVTSCSFSIVFFFTACLQNLDVRHFCKKKIWVNPANSMDSFFCNRSLVHCVALSMPEIPALDIPPACQNDPIVSSVAVPAPTSPNSASTFELLLTLIHPSKRVRTSNRKTKNMKPESENKGPYDVPVNIGWDAFLDVVAEKLMVVPSSLVVIGFEWHWLKPASGPWLPVQNENGFASMLKKVKSKSEPYVIVC